jgi:hypothetical protein
MFTEITKKFQLLTNKSLIIHYRVFIIQASSMIKIFVSLLLGFRTCPTRTATGTSFASSAPSVRNRWWISPSPPRTTTSSVPTAMTTTLPQDATAVETPSVEVSFEKKRTYDFTPL